MAIKSWIALKVKSWLLKDLRPILHKYKSSAYLQAKHEFDKELKEVREHNLRTIKSITNMCEREIILIEKKAHLEQSRRARRMLKLEEELDEATAYKDEASEVLSKIKATNSYWKTKFSLFKNGASELILLDSYIDELEIDKRKLTKQRPNPNPKVMLHNTEKAYDKNPSLDDEIEEDIQIELEKDET